MRADLFEELDTFKNRMDQMIQEIKKIPLAEGYNRIYLPGEIELERSIELEKKGIPLSDHVFTELTDVARRYDVALPSF